MSGLCAVCNEETERKCAACKAVYYCSQMHQRQNWKAHKGSCRAFEVCHSEVLGKYLKATRNLKPGDVIFIEYPLVFGPKPHFIEEGPIPCPGCCMNISVNSKEKCEGCGWLVCDPSCAGLKDPIRHGLECKLLNLKQSDTKERYKTFRSDILIGIRALLLSKLNKAKWSQLIDLESHLEHRGPGSEIYNVINDKVNIIKTILPDIPVKTIHQIYGIFDVNATELSEDIEVEILYYIASLMEHDCVPNTCQIIDNSDKFKITVKAALPIKAGEHISSMYTHALWGTQARREHLKNTKFFICRCKRCEDPTELGTYFSAFKCLNCDGYYLPIDENQYGCDSCEIKLKNEEVTALFNSIDEEVDLAISYGSNVKRLEEILEKLSPLLHPNHYHVYSIKHSLVQMYGNYSGIKDENLLNKTISMCMELIEITNKLDPGKTRLNIYSAILLNELFSAEFSLLQLEKNKTTITEIDEIAENAKEILQNELNTSAGSKLFAVIQKSQLVFRNWVNNLS